MLFRKTPTSERGNYVYRFNDGTVSVIAEGSEAEVWIRSLHSFDDAEVYNNIKNSRPQLEPWQKKALEEWKAQTTEMHVTRAKNGLNNYELTLLLPKYIIDMIIEYDNGIHKTLNEIGRSNGISYPNYSVIKGAIIDNKAIMRVDDTNKFNSKTHKLTFSKLKYNTAEIDLENNAEDF